jgi:hypothetical protein
LLLKILKDLDYANRLESERVKLVAARENSKNMFRLASLIRCLRVPTLSPVEPARLRVMD